MTVSMPVWSPANDPGAAQSAQSVTPPYVQPGRRYEEAAPRPYARAAAAAQEAIRSSSDTLPAHRAAPGEYDWWQHRLVRPGKICKMDCTWSAAGWPQLADDLWRVVHSDRSGTRRADSALIGLGLAAALVIEPLLGGQVVLNRDGHLRLASELGAALDYRTQAAAISGRAPVALVPDRIANEFLMLIYTEPDLLSLETWLAYLAPLAPEQVAQRLVDAGHLHIERPRRFLGRTIIYRPVNTNVAVWPAIRLQSPMRGGELDPVDLALLGLCRAMGMDRWLFDDQPPDLVAKLLREPDRLPQPFPQLWRQLDAVMAVSASRLH
ncbi:GPP34 family phosphoprotein [Actinoplanes sp. NPDC020271]|uniref:GOLPH3/VPS74 family protein n=1 Tax=Actinoplanes sp. NPDC020271 TaxID=3363896 RepID=UPI0037B5E986